MFTSDTYRCLLARDDWFQPTLCIQSLGDTSHVHKLVPELTWWHFFTMEKAGSFLLPAKFQVFIVQDRKSLVPVGRMNVPVAVAKPAHDSKIPGRLLACYPSDRLFDPMREPA